MIMRRGVSTPETRRSAARPWRTATLAAALLAAFLLASCTDRNAMPTLPEAGGEPSEWQRLYPALTNQTLIAAWGLDADDMWAVGDQGTILHYDGRSLQPITAPTDADLTAISGLARDAIWAVSAAGEILVWDGLSWAVIHVIPNATLLAVCAVTPNQVLVGGSSLVEGNSYAAIWHREGGAWRSMNLATEGPGTVRRIWNAGDGLPLMAATEGAILHLSGTTWRISYTQRMIFCSADRDRVLLTRYYLWDFYLSSISADGTLHPLCLFNPEENLAHLSLSRQPLLASGAAVLKLDGCTRVLAHTGSFIIRDLVVPVLTGSEGPAAFAVGQDAGFARLTWQPAGTIAAAELTPAPSARLLAQLAGDGRRLIALDWQGRLLAREDGRWQELPTPWPAHVVFDLDDGTLALIGDDLSLALGDGDHPWQVLPECPVAVQALWIDSARRPRVIAFNDNDLVWELWGLETADWILLGALPLSCHTVTGFDGFSTDDLYVICADDETARLLHHDGASWNEVFPDPDIAVMRIRAGRRSGVLYLEGRDSAQQDFSGYLDQGELTILADRHLAWSDLVETGPGRAFCRESANLYQLESQAWTILPGPDNLPLRRLWAHPDQGLFIITGRDEIFRRDLPRGTP